MASSIRTTLVRQLTIIMIVVSIAVMFSIALLTLYTANTNLKNTEKQLLQALLTKGNTLVVNNGQALIDMVNDNSFSSIQNLVSATVHDDDDIIYGVFMDTSRRPWVIVNRNDTEQINLLGGPSLDDEMSMWASGLKDSAFKAIDIKTAPVYSGIGKSYHDSKIIYEFAAPVYAMVDTAVVKKNQKPELLGTIRYGISTAQMDLARDEAQAFNRRIMIYTLLIVVGLGVIAFIFAYTATRYATTQITKPLDELSKATLDIAAGNYDAPIDIVTESDNEVGVLSRSFKTMQIKIKQALNQLMRHQEELTVKNRDLELTQTELENLNKHLEEKVSERTAELKAVQKVLVDTARAAGMAEIAINVLHNIGNVINSVNVANQDNYAILKRSKVATLVRTNELLEDHSEDLAEYISQDEKGKKIPELLNMLGTTLYQENQTLLENSNRMMQGIGIIGNIISTQEKYAKAKVYNEAFYIQSVVDEALEVQTASFNKYDVKVSTEMDDVPALMGDRSKLHQVITNLLVNALHALIEMDAGDRRILIRLYHEGKVIKLTIQDNGIGIPKDRLIDIFQHGYTTKKSGHGFGLHSCANFIGEMGGSIVAKSDGPGTGACFMIELPDALISKEAQYVEADSNKDSVVGE